MQKERHTSTFQRHQHTKEALGNPKDKDPQNNQTGITYHYQCPQINCLSAYIGESGRPMGERVKEHFKAPSPIHLYSTTTGHPMDPEQFNIVHKEVNNHSRTIKEAMLICVQDPTLNRNLGNTSYLTYGTTYFWHHQPYSANLPTMPTLTPFWLPPAPSSHCPCWQGAYTFMVSTHICPKHTPYTPHQI